MNKEEIKKKIDERFKEMWEKAKNSGKVDAFLKKHEEILINLAIEETAKAIFEEIEKMTHFCGNQEMHIIPNGCFSDKNLLVEKLKEKWLK